MQLYDQEEIMRVHDKRIEMDSKIQATVETCQEFGMNFIDTIDKIAKKYSLSKERAEIEVREYWIKQ